MTLEIMLLVALFGLGFSAARWMARRLGEQPVAESDLEKRETDRSLGVRDGDRLDVWIPEGTSVPTKVLRLLRGTPEDGLGLRLSLYAGANDAPERAEIRLVRIWLGPYPDAQEPVLVEVTLAAGRFGELRVHAIDKATGRKLAITRDERDAAPPTVITTRRTPTGKTEPS